MWYHPKLHYRLLELKNWNRIATYGSYATTSSASRCGRMYYFWTSRWKWYVLYGVLCFLPQNDNTLLCFSFLDNLSIQCIEIFNKFIISLTAVQMSSWSRDIFLPRVLSQIETLPSLARSGRNSDLISTTRLIAGYLKAFLLMSNMNKGQGKSKTNLHSFLVTQLTTKEIRRCFVGKCKTIIICK